MALRIMRPLVLFPSNPLAPREPDASFAAEAAHAAAAGFAVGFIDLEVYLGGEVKLRGLPESAGEVLYRGWILDLDAYARMDAALLARGQRLVTPPDAYRHIYHLPEWYEAVGGAAVTPRSIWFPGASFDVAEIAARVAAAFGDAPVLLKDYVKSRKHEWYDACYIASAADEVEVRRVLGNFLRLMDEGLVGGLVFRAFVPLRRVGLHSKSRLPLAREYRLFVLDGRPFYVAPYWSEGDYQGAPPEEAVIASILPRVRSRFYAADVAEREEGGWELIELNDGGSAGVPEGGSGEAFYARLGEAFARA
jgi:hypothetical protein